MNFLTTLLMACLILATPTIAVQTCGQFCSSCPANDDVCSQCQTGYALRSATCDCISDKRCGGCQCALQPSDQSTTRIILIALLSTVGIISLGLLFLYLYEARNTGPGPSFSEVARRIRETEAVSVQHLRPGEQRTNQLNLEEYPHQPPPLDQIQLRFNSSPSEGSDTWRNLVVPTVRIERT